jgi:hypothetical protein
VVGLHAPELLILLILLLVLAAPWVVGFAWMLPDANRRGQPGVLWALVTIPLSWVAVLAYLIVRAITEPRFYA